MADGSYEDMVCRYEKAVLFLCKKWSRILLSQKI